MQAAAAHGVNAIIGAILTAAHEGEDGEADGGRGGRERSGDAVVEAGESI